MTKQTQFPSRRSVLSAGAALAGAATMASAVAETTGSAAIDLTGQSVLITGSSSGFGRLSALHLARSGAKVMASMRNMENGKRPEAQELAQIARDEKLDLHLIEIDVRDDKMVSDGVSEAEELAGGALDVLINNAGIGIGGPVELQDQQAVELMFDTNVFGYHRMARAALPAMRARGEGLIFAVSSQLGRFLFPNIGVYQVCARSNVRGHGL